MKKFISMLLALFCIVSLGACAEDDYTSDLQSEEHSESESVLESEFESDSEGEGTEAKPTKYKLNHNTEGIKVLGVRCIQSPAQVNCDWTCSGIEMNINHEGGDIIFDIGSDKGCYFKAYIDGKEFTNPFTHFNVNPGRNQVKLVDVPKGRHLLRLVKATGYTLARSQIYSVTFTGEILKSTPADNDLYIEYIGDSISCGWGVIGNHQGAYTDQDGTLAYPYLVSQKLNADYSITALSGQGLLCGDPGIPKGYLYGSALRSDQTEYAFERKADVVVINIGTNDYSLKKDEEAAFKVAYQNLINTVRAKNGNDCKIVCIYNTMNDTFQDSIKELCANKEANGIYLVEFARTASGHPTKSENITYTNQLTAYLQNTVLK